MCSLTNWNLFSSCCCVNNETMFSPSPFNFLIKVHSCYTIILQVGLQVAPDHWPEERNMKNGWDTEVRTGGLRVPVIPSIFWWQIYLVVAGCGWSPRHAQLSETIHWRPGSRPDLGSRDLREVRSQHKLEGSESGRCVPEGILGAQGRNWARNAGSVTSGHAETSPAPG